MSFSHSDFDFLAPVWNTAEIMRQAWSWAKDDRDYHSAYDWTPGSNYGQRVAVPAATRRAIFAKYLARAWAAAKARVEQEERDWIKQTHPEIAAMARDLESLKWTPQGFGLQKRINVKKAQLEEAIQAARTELALKRDMARKAALIVSAGGRIVSVTFTKKDGSKRIMKINSAKLRHHLKGEDASPAAQRAAQTRKERHPHLMPVWDIEADAARSVNLLTVSRIATGGRVYRFAA